MCVYSQLVIRLPAPMHIMKTSLTSLSSSHLIAGKLKLCGECRGKEPVHMYYQLVIQTPSLVHTMKSSMTSLSSSTKRTCAYVLTTCDTNPNPSAHDEVVSGVIVVVAPSLDKAEAWRRISRNELRKGVRPLLEEKNLCVRIL